MKTPLSVSGRKRRYRRRTTSALRATLIFFLAPVLVLVTATGVMASGYDFSGLAGLEGRGFFEEERYPGQERNNGSFFLQPEYRYGWSGGSAITVIPFLRVDSADEERTHFDLRELNVLLAGERAELVLGLDKVFWGATEFVHLVDIINQTDLVEQIDGEEKLGQPMLHVSVASDWGTVDAFILPFFRERTFPGKSGRLRGPLYVDPDEARYENGAEERHVDFAVRYSHTIGNVDFGVHHFWGTGREPILTPVLNDGGELVLASTYPQIDQTGVDVQAVLGGWLVKFEGFRRTGQGDLYHAAAGGIEYTFFAVLDSKTDIGCVAEYAWDERNDSATTPYQDDLMLGLRLALNDPAGSQALFGYIRDTENRSGILTLESRRRIGDDWTVSLEGAVFLDQPRKDYLYGLRDDDFLSLEISYYF